MTSLTPEHPLLYTFAKKTSLPLRKTFHLRLWKELRQDIFLLTFIPSE